MRSVRSFLKTISELAEAQKYRESLEQMCTSVSVVDLYSNNIVEHQEFSNPPFDKETYSFKKDIVHISYSVDKTIATSAKDYAKTGSYGELGKFTFDYYVKMEEINGNE